MHDRCWEPGTQYNYNDVVQYEGHRYKIIQPHRSQSDWAPSVTPALWGRQSDYDSGGGGGCDPHCQPQPHCQQQQQQPQQQQYQQAPQQVQQPPQYQQGGQSDKPEHPEEKKHWYGDEGNKKKLEIGAGLVGGAALLAGGVFAYKEHEKHKEEAKNTAWAHDNWVQDARGRTDQYHQRGPNAPATWILVQGTAIPRGALAVGQEHGRTLYSIRAHYKEALVLGKASEAFKKGGIIGYADDEIEVDVYEILVGDQSHLRWVSASGKLNVGSLGCRPVEGGREKDGTPVYVARAPHKDGTHPGKASEKLDGAYIPYGGKEKVIKEYQVLCYN